MPQACGWNEEVTTLERRAACRIRFALSSRVGVHSISYFPPTQRSRLPIALWRIDTSELSKWLFTRSPFRRPQNSHRTYNMTFHSVWRRRARGIASDYESIEVAIPRTDPPKISQHLFLLAYTATAGPVDGIAVRYFPGIRGNSRSYGHPKN